MNLIKRVAVPSSVLGLALCIAAYWLNQYFQGLFISGGVMLLGFSLAVAVVNGYLNNEEKKRAAVPLLKMIHPSLAGLHNRILIENGRLTFGIPTFNALLDAYQQNNRDPKALSPEQRDGLYEIVKSNKAEVERLIEELYEQLKEMSFLLGWSFSPSLIRASLDCRLSIVKLQNTSLDDSTQAKLDACKLILDIDAQASAVLTELAGLLGKTMDEIASG